MQRKLVKLKKFGKGNKQIKNIIYAHMSTADKYAFCYTSQGIWTGIFFALGFYRALMSIEEF